MMKWTFFAGLGVGAAVGMLVAPKSGSELRGDMQDLARDSYERGREKLQPVLDEARHRVEPALNDLRDRVEGMADDVRERAGALAGHASELGNQIADKASGLKEQVVNRGLLAILNDWPHERLIEIDGIGPVLATKIIRHRPYESEQALLDLKELPPSAIECLRKAA